MDPQLAELMAKQRRRAAGEHRSTSAGSRERRHSNDRGGTSSPATATASGTGGGAATPTPNAATPVAGPNSNSSPSSPSAGNNNGSSSTNNSTSNNSMDEDDFPPAPSSTSVTRRGSSTIVNSPNAASNPSGGGEKEQRRPSGGNNPGSGASTSERRGSAGPTSSGGASGDGSDRRRHHHQSSSNSSSSRSRRNRSANPSSERDGTGVAPSPGLSRETSASSNSPAVPSRSGGDRTPSSSSRRGRKTSRRKKDTPKSGEKSRRRSMSRGDYSSGEEIGVDSHTDEDEDQGGGDGDRSGGRLSDDNHESSSEEESSEKGGLGITTMGSPGMPSAMSPAGASDGSVGLSGPPPSMSADFASAFGSDPFGANFSAAPAAAAASAAASSPSFGSENFAAGGGGGGGGATADDSAAAFESTFGSFPTDFGNFPMSTLPTTVEEEEDDSYVPPSFGLPALAPLPAPKPVYDKSPIENPPTVPNPLEYASTIKLSNPRPVLMQPSNPAPRSNPLNGHLILCRRHPQTGELSLCEWNPHTKAQVVSVPILSLDVQRKVAQKYNVNPSAVDTVLTLAVGIHQGHGYVRTRVACLMDLVVLGNNEILRVIAIWQWGYASAHHPVQLQSVLSPPSGSDFSYNPESLLISDSCVFVSGASAKGPCVFLCKPTIKETWSANFVGKESSRIASMAVMTSPCVSSDSTKAPERKAYLAIALTDGSLSVWTYEAVTKVSAKTTEALRRLLYPLCRLEGVRILRQCQPTHWNNGTDTSSSSPSKEVGYCTHLQWISPRTPAFTQLFILAAAFQGALCFYHVALPKVQDTKKGGYHSIKPPTISSQLSTTVVLKPFGLARWPVVYHKASLSFCDLGPHMPPTVAVMLTGLNTNLDYARLALVTCQLTMYGSSSPNSGGGGGGSGGSDGTSKGLEFSRAPLQVWDSHEWTNNSFSHLPRGLLPCTYMPGILYFSDTALQLVGFHKDPTSLLAHQRGGLGSLPVGLNTPGTYFRGDTKTDKAGVLSVYTTFHCERRKSSDQETLDWTAPTRRHWLIQTLVGDNKQSMGEDVMEKETTNDDGVVTGGTHSKVVCELGGSAALHSLVPCRIVRNPADGTYTAVHFRDITGNKVGQDSTMIAMIEQNKETGKSSIVQFMDGRELVFLPNQMDEDLTTPIPQALLVSRNGGSIALWQRKFNSATKTHWQKSIGMACRPILGVRLDETPGSAAGDDAPDSNASGSGDHKDDTERNVYVECRQLILARFQDQVGLVAVATKADGTSCIISGSLEPDEGLVWSNILPNIKEDPVLWLEAMDEQVCQLVSLPWEQSVRGGFAVATSHRVMILSSDLEILAQVKVNVPPTSLVPMGCFTVAYCSNDDHKVRYLSGLSAKNLCSGVIASLPLPMHSYCPYWLLAVRPDRLVYSQYHCGTRLVERGQSPKVFLLPPATVRPALLLEPLIANAIATAGGESAGTQSYFRTIVEKFGRKVATMTHGEDEGIGNFGAGLTPRVLELLNRYNLMATASWLLTGTVHFDRSSNSRLLPAWMPVSAKVKAATDADTNLHVIASGDQYFSEYVKSPDHNMSATLPRPSDPSSTFSHQFAVDALKHGKTVDALKLLDIAGTETSDSMLLQISLALQVDPFKDVTPILSSLCQQDSQIGKLSGCTTPGALAALSLELKKSYKNGSNGAGTSSSEDFTKRWMRQLAPSIQRGKRCMGRQRQRIIGETAFSKIMQNSSGGGGSGLEPKDRSLFNTEANESKHVWNEGPNREKENLLLLDHIQEWFGRRRPVLLGREGVKSAEDRGASTLADILNQGDDDSFGAENEDDFKDGWVEGVGEGQKDENKLSAYFRFSEGEDEDSSWREEGFSDISKFDVKAFLVGCNESAKLEESTSSVDEGEHGKVKALFDLVFDQAGVGLAAALALPAARGGSLDVGMLHGPDHMSRQKCSLEFWFWVPDAIKSDVVLVRRTFGSSADDLDNVCKATDKSSTLWELILSKVGELEFRTVAGGKVKSEPTEPSSDDDNDDDEDEKKGPQSTILMGRWNHVCITLKQESITSSTVGVFVKGVSACSGTLSFTPPNFELDEFSGASALDPILEKSHLVYGLDHPKGFRLAELRVWALERNDDDIRTFMTEYLNCAETKKKFRVKIKKKGGAGGKLGQPKSGAATGGLAPPKGTLAPPGGAGASSNRPSKRGLLAPPKGSKEGSTPRSVSPQKESTSFGFESMDAGFGNDGFGSMAQVAPAIQGSAQMKFDSSFTSPSPFSPHSVGASSHDFSDPAGSPPTFGAGTAELDVTGGRGSGDDGIGMGMGGDDGFGDIAADPSSEMMMMDDELPEISPLWDSAIPLSEQVRSSAAAALIRGPPATRHFGGNRGGLPDYRELERFGVGAISICGSEKTIVWRDDQTPPGLTYPIGASGAIVSDQMDEDGSEFLCCFLAKDKRMVVFELSTRTVVVELQMTTKLNYWRFLPPEAGEDTLCFMLVTPVGGFHWMPLDESPRPRQVWKRGPELQGKKIVCYEEGGTNGLDGPDMLSKVGMLLVTNASTGGRLEAWLVPICGDSQAICASDDMLGACLCRPPDVGYEAWMPLLLFVVESEGDLIVCVSAVTEATETSIGLTEVMTDALIEQGPYRDMDFEPPTLAMGTWPEVLCCSLGSTIVIIVRRKGLVVAYELADTGLELIAQENVGHYVVDAVMRYSAVEGGAEIVLLMSDSDNPRDGRVGTFCFRTAL